MAGKELKEKPDGWAVVFPCLTRETAEAIARALPGPYFRGIIPRYADVLNIRDYARGRREDA